MKRPLLMALACALSAITLAPTAATAAPAPNDPVVIVAGLFGPAFFYEPMAARFRADGTQAFVFQLTNIGTGDIAETAEDLAAFVAGVRAETGAAKVDLVGHSEGGLVSRQYVKFEGGASTVDSLVTLGTPNYGTAVANILDFIGAGRCLGIVACEQMAIGSDFLTTLNAGDDTIGAVRYTNIYTALDELVRPVENAALRDGATNVLTQSQCPLRLVEHLNLALDGAVYDGIRDTLRGEPVRLNCLAI
jgi:triacylglycerol esterase/lipase EstA (alpha/beta hydrolase family)